MFRRGANGNLESQSSEYGIIVCAHRSPYGIDRRDVTIAGTRIGLSTTVAASPDEDRTFSVASLEVQWR